jgi:hypothetical protein
MKVCSDSRMKGRPLVWRLTIGLLAMSATGLIAILGADAAVAIPSPVNVPQSIVAPMQSCNDAYDQTGVGGAGIGQIRAGEKGFYSFSIAFNADFIAAHPPTTDFVWGEARLFVDGKYAFSIPTGHPRPLAESFHGLIKLQGYKYGRRNRLTIQRGNFLSFRISLLLIDPVSGTFYPGHGTISCRL